MYLVHSHLFLSPHILALTLFAFFPTRGLLRFRRYYLVLGRGDSPPGGDDGNRTHDPLLAGQVLSQLSYTPIWGFLFLEFPFGHSKLNNKLYAHSSLAYFSRRLSFLVCSISEFRYT